MHAGSAPCHPEGCLCNLFLQSFSHGHFKPPVRTSLTEPLTSPGHKGVGSPTGGYLGCSWGDLHRQGLLCASGAMHTPVLGFACKGTASALLGGLVPTMEKEAVTNVFSAGLVRKEGFPL